jgi:hypothetical protein
MTFEEHVNEADELEMDDEAKWTKGLPDALVKAVADPFQYALMLRDGTIIEFEGAAPPSATGWVLLNGPRVVNRGYNACLERGIEVRLAEIAWVADAPHGS